MTKRINLSNKERYYILSRDAFTCQYCGRKAPDVELHVDHLIPVARGGTNSHINLLASCADCNLSKQASLLPEEIIKEKQEDILYRTKHYQKHIKNNPLQDTKEDLAHLTKRPKKLLNIIKGITEPLKTRSLNKNKRHTFTIYIEDVFTLDAVYGRLDKAGWFVEPVDTQLQALNNKEYRELIKAIEFTQVDHLIEGGLEVHLYKNQESGVHLLIVTDEKGSVPYSFYSPLKSLEVGLSITDDSGETPSDDELEFYSM